jgi:cytochrome c5
MTDQHSSFIKNWKQLLVVVALAFLIPIILIAFLTQLVTNQFKPTPADDSAALARIKPVGDVVLAEASGPVGQKTGEQVFQQVCKACHEAGLAGSPKFGDKAAWAHVLAQGQQTTFQHAISGIRAMPPKGGNPDLTNEEVQRAAAYMANAADANWTAPPVAAAAPAGGSAERTGQQVVDAVCGKCHASGANGAPKIGDQAAWRERASRGLATVTTSALRGHAGMPARGGMAELSDTEVKRAIEYMMNAGTGAVMAGTPAPAAAAAPTAPVATATASAAGAKPDGKKIYDSTCTACHAAGLVGAPKFGDKAAWAPRIKQGIDTLHASALQGKNAMPPKGGNNALSDAEVLAAVDYMVSAAK